MHKDSTKQMIANGRGIGIWSYEQLKYLRPIHYLGTLIFGLPFCALGIFYLLNVYEERQAEARAFGRPDLHADGLLVGIGFIAFGLLIVHVSIIYYWRRVRSLMQKKGKTRLQ
jgi:hypothetical protein